MSHLQELYACVCAKEFPAQALLRMRPQLRDRACVVMEGEPPLQQVCSLNRKARQLGLVHSMTKVEVETFPSVAVFARSAEEEASARTALLECAGSYSPRVEECSDGGVLLFVLDIAGTEKLFGPAEALARKLLLRIKDLGISACIAVSGNFHVSVTAAKGLSLANPIKVIPDGEETEALAPLPLAVLDLTDDAEMFALWGIHTLGMLADLPEKELIARMGQRGKRLRQQARGDLPHLFRPVEPVFALTERMELESPVEALDTLLFVVNLMLAQLIRRATARVLAIVSVTIRLVLQGGAAHTRTVRPALPTIDRRLWLKLLHLDLETHPPQAAIVAVTLDAEPGRTSKVQLGLFSPQLPEPSRLDVTLARIAAIVGEQNVGRAMLKDTHSDDGFGMNRFLVPSAKAIEASNAPVRTVLRKLRPAQTILVVLMNGRPHAFFFRERRYAVERAYGPWLSCGEWWNRSLWEREQWDLAVRAQSGEMLCCCIVRDLVRDRWQMDALYD